LCEQGQRQIDVAHRRVGTGQHDLPPLAQVGRREFGLQLVQVSYGLGVFLHVVQSGSEQQVGVIQMLRARGGCKKPPKDGGGGFCLALVDQSLGLRKHRGIRQRRFEFRRGGRLRLHGGSCQAQGQDDDQAAAGKQS